MHRLAIAALLIGAATSNAVELNYQWKKGDVHRFQYEDASVFDISMMGMAQKSLLTVRSTFSERILAVRPDGTAEAELSVEKLDIMQAGKSVGTVEQLPASARVVRAELDRKGHVKFLRMVTVYLRENQLFVGVSATPTGVQGTATDANGDRIDLVAGWDPKTGRLSAGASVTRKEPAKAELKRDDPHVDLFPRRLFELMVLPDGQLEPGGTATLSTPLGDVVLALAPLEKDLARLRVTMEGNKVEAGAHGMVAKKKDGTTAMDVEVEDDAPPQGLPAMGGMMGMGGPAGAPTAGVQQDLDLTASFDVAKGRLLGVDGTAHQTMSMSGMANVDVDAVFKLSRL